MRDVMEQEGATADVLQCVEEPSIPIAQELMAICDMTLATGGPAMVRAAYSSGKPAFGVGHGNATIVIDETADIEEAARNTRLSKTSDFGSGCSADGNVLIDERIYDDWSASWSSKADTSSTQERRKNSKGRCGTGWRPHHRDGRPTSPQAGGGGWVRHPRRQAVHHRGARRALGTSTGSRGRN